MGKMESELFKRQHGTCALCGRPISEERHISTEHIIPRSAWHTSPPRANSLYTHHVCNWRKGNSTPSVAHLDYACRIWGEVKFLGMLRCYIDSTENTSRAEIHQMRERVIEWRASRGFANPADDPRRSHRTLSINPAPERTRINRDGW